MSVEPDLGAAQSGPTKLVSHLERVDEFCQLAFVVSSFVFVDDVLLGQTVQHRRHFLQQLLSRRFVSGFAQALDGRTGGFMLVTVQHALGFVAADAFEGRLMVCHEQEIYRSVMLEFCVWEGKGTKLPRLFKYSWQKY